LFRFGFVLFLIDEEVLPPQLASRYDNIMHDIDDFDDDFGFYEEGKEELSKPMDLEKASFEGELAEFISLEAPRREVKHTKTSNKQTNKQTISPFSSFFSSRSLTLLALSLSFPFSFSLCVLLSLSLSQISRRFKIFLRTFRDDETPESSPPLYVDRIRHMCALNQRSLEVSFVHLAQDESTRPLAMWLADAPTEMLEVLEETALKEVLAHFPAYEKIAQVVHVRITQLPQGDSLRDIRHIHLNGLIRVGGVVTRRTSVYPQIKLAKYDCNNCGAILGPFLQGSAAGGEVKPTVCFECQSKGPFTLNHEQVSFRFRLFFLHLLSCCFLLP